MHGSSWRKHECMHIHTDVHGCTHIVVVPTYIICEQLHGCGSWVWIGAVLMCVMALSAWF